MWTEEDEEKYKDLECIRGLMKWKRTVKGDLVNDTYIAEKKVSFELMPFFNQEISLYLPEGAPGKHCAETFCYFDDMGAYEEYVSEDNTIFFTLEKCRDSHFHVETEDGEDIYKQQMDLLGEKYFDTLLCQHDSFFISEYDLRVYVIRAMAEIQDESYEGLIYCISDDYASYRVYITSCKRDVELLDVLGKNIVKNMKYQRGK